MQALLGEQAMEPFFSVLLSALFLGEKATAPVLLTLLPIVGGVAAASISEVLLVFESTRAAKPDCCLPWRPWSTVLPFCTYVSICAACH
jgi:hypothetical protein